MTKMTKILKGLIAISVVALFAVGLRPPADAGEAPRAAVFDEKGLLALPDGWRKWIFLGSPLTPNALNSGSAYLPEFKNVYLDRASFEHWEKTGEFRDGAVVVKELVSVGSTEAMTGKGFFQGDFIGMEVAVKDRKRFPKDQNGWGFFSFGKPPYSAKVRPITGTDELDCAGCHLRAEGDMIFAKFYPVLLAARPKK